MGVFLKNPNTGKLLSFGGKLLTKPYLFVSTQSIYADQVLPLPYGDEIFVTVNSEEHIVCSSDLDVETLWGKIGNGIVHWGYSAGVEYVNVNNPIHLYEINLYDEPEYLEAVSGTGAEEAEYIMAHGRYMGSFWIEDEHWVVRAIKEMTNGN